MDLITTKGLSVSVIDPSLSNHFYAFFYISLIHTNQILLKKLYINEYSSASLSYHPSHQVLLIIWWITLIQKRGLTQLAQTKLQVLHDIYKKSLKAYNLALKSARESFFSNINNSNPNNEQTVYSVIKTPQTPLQTEGIRRAIHISVSNLNVRSPPCLYQRHIVFMRTNVIHV